MKTRTANTSTFTILATTCSALLASACVEQEDNADAKDAAWEIIERYELEGDLVFLDPERQEAFQFTTPAAEARFHEELELAGFGFERDETFRNVVVNWIGTGSSSHTVDEESELVGWHFTTTNNSTRNKVAANVSGTVFHPDGATLDCTNNNYVSGNTCSIYTTIDSNYSSSVGSHRACEKKHWYSSWNCTPWFQTADSL